MATGETPPYTKLQAQQCFCIHLNAQFQDSGLASFGSTIPGKKMQSPECNAQKQNFINSASIFIRRSVN